jgi:hypothetical protein
MRPPADYTVEQEQHREYIEENKAGSKPGAEQPGKEQQNTSHRKRYLLVSDLSDTPAQKYTADQKKQPRDEA